MNTHSEKTFLFDVRVILVSSIYERNIGYCSRAMSNMGVTNLILIKPKCELRFEAQQAAATGQKALQGRRVYQSWEEFYHHEQEGIRIAFTARDGKARQVQDLKNLLSDISRSSPLLNAETITNIDLIFGPEDAGLSANDLEQAHFAACLPTYGENASLNLSQAVLLALFILRDQWGGERTILDGHKKILKSEKADFPETQLREFLLQMGFDLSARRINAFTVLKKMLMRNTPTAKENQILHIVLNQGIRKLEEYNKLRK